MFNTPFRREALVNKNQRQQLDHLLRVTSTHERLVLAGIGLVLLALAAWVFFGTLVRSVTIDGVLIAAGARHEVVSTEPGQLLEFLVAPGEHVEPGKPVARQSVPGLDREMAALRDRIELLETEIGQTGSGGALHSRLVSARVALAQLQARRSARELIVSQTGGEVTALRAAPGRYLTVGSVVVQLRDREDLPPRAVLRVAPRVAQRIRPGMQASIDVAMPDGTTRRWPGEVAAVTTGPVPEWLAVLDPAAVESAHRVDVLLHQASDLSVPDGTPSRIRIVLGRYSPAMLFDVGRS